MRATVPAPYCGVLQPQKAAEGKSWGEWGEYSSGSTMWGSQGLRGDGGRGGRVGWLHARGLSKSVKILRINESQIAPCREQSDKQAMGGDQSSAPVLDGSADGDVNSRFSVYTVNIKTLHLPRYREKYRSSRRSWGKKASG